MHSFPTQITGVSLVESESSCFDCYEAAEQWASSFAWADQISCQAYFMQRPGYVPAANAEQAIMCTSGSLFVVAVDLRPGSFGETEIVRLLASERRQLFVPSGVALGWQALEESEIAIASTHDPRAEHRNIVLHWNDPNLRIPWPSFPSRIACPERPGKFLDQLEVRDLPTRFLASEKPSATPSAIKQPNRAQKKKPRAAPQRLRALVPPQRPKRDQKSKILILGGGDKLGRDLSLRFRALGEVIRVRSSCRGNRLQGSTLSVDIAQPASLRALVREHRPNLIVNAASLTDIQQAESEPRLAQAINATAPAILAEEGQRIGAGLLHFCSDMVYGDVRTRPHREVDEPKPSNRFARSKADAVGAIEGTGIPHMIIRTGWLYSQFGANFVRQLIDTMSYRRTVTLPSDHFGTPTSTNWISNILVDVLNRSSGDFAGWMSEFGGLYNVSCAGYADRVDVAKLLRGVCQELKVPLAVKNIVGRPLDELRTGVPYPRNCQLDTRKFQAKFAIELPDWKDELRKSANGLIQEDLFENAA